MERSLPFHIETIDHIVLRAVDVERMRTFYCDVLGCVAERDQASIGLLQLRAGDALIDLVDIHGKLGGPADIHPTYAARNMDHLCLRVAPWDEAALLAHLTRHGVSIGEFGLRFGAEGQGRSIYLNDPEGNTVELKAAAGTSGMAGRTAVAQSMA